MDDLVGTWLCLIMDVPSESGVTSVCSLVVSRLWFRNWLDVPIRRPHLRLTQMHEDVMPHFDAHDHVPKVGVICSAQQQTFIMTPSSRPLHLVLPNNKPYVFGYFGLMDPRRSRVCV